MLSAQQIQGLISSDQKVLSNFTSKESKKSGKRWGFIGTYGNEKSSYLVKREFGGYPTVLTKCDNDMMVIECLSANLIKIILGDTFAAETGLVRLDCDSFTRHAGNSLVTEDIPHEYLANYGLASKMIASDAWEKNKKILYNDNEQLIKLSLVAAVLGVTDIKPEHLITHLKDEGNHYTQHVALIDCAADLNGFKKTLDELLAGNCCIRVITPKDYGIVLEVFSYIVNNQSSLIEAVDKYKDIPVSNLCTNDKIKAKLKKIVTHVQKCIPLLEDKIQMQIEKKGIKLQHFETGGLKNLLESFPEKYRLPILLANIKKYNKEDEDGQSEIRALIPQADHPKIPITLSIVENIAEKSKTDIPTYGFFYQKNTTNVVHEVVVDSQLTNNLV